MSEIATDQIKVVTGATDNDTLDTSGRVDEKIDGKVSKTGDTMTGDLTINAKLSVDNIDIDGFNISTNTGGVLTLLSPAGNVRIAPDGDIDLEADGDINQTSSAANINIEATNGDINFTGNNILTTIDASSTHAQYGTAKSVYDAIIAAGGGSLDQEQIYYVGKAGSDTNSGLNINSPVLTIAQAITLVNAQTPSSSNQFLIKIIDDGIYDEDIIIPSYCHIYGEGAILTQKVTFNDDSMLTVKEFNTSSFPAGASAWLKTSGTGRATANILDTLRVNLFELCENTSGTMVINCKNCVYGGAVLKWCSGTTIFNCQGELVGGLPFLRDSATAGDYHIKYHKLTGTASGGASFLDSSGGASIYIDGGDTIFTGPSIIFAELNGGSKLYGRLGNNFLTGSGSKLYDLQSASDEINLDIMSYSETTASTAVAGSTVVLNVKSDSNGQTIIDNQSNGLVVKGNSVIGFNGNESRIKILPHHFLANDDGSFGDFFWNDTSNGVGVVDPINELFCFIEIPYGYKATDVRIYSNATLNVIVNAQDISSGTQTSVGSGTTASEFSITDTSSTNTNYLVIETAVTSSANLVYGGYVTIERI